VQGKDYHGCEAIPDENTLFRNKHTGEFNRTFTRVAQEGDAPKSHIYWSSTPARSMQGSVHVLDFKTGMEGFYSRDRDRLSCRPVRFVPAGGPR
jgi:hypothetical protein